MAGKGSRLRPLSVDSETYENNWERIFSKNVKERQRTEDHRKRKQALDELTHLSEEMGVYNNELRNPLIKKR